MRIKLGSLIDSSVKSALIEFCSVSLRPMILQRLEVVYFPFPVVSHAAGSEK
jgi:hypothetical protein